MPTIKINPAKVNLEFRQGDDVTLRFQFATDLSDRIFRAQIRELPESEAILAAFDFTTSVLASGIVVAQLTSVQTTDLPELSSWDMEYSLAGKVQTIFAGTVLVSRQITK